MSLCESRQALRRALCLALWIPAAFSAVLATAEKAAAQYDPIDPQLNNFTFVAAPRPKLLVSASSTDPHVQTAPPFSGLFNLYLWLEEPSLHPVSAIELGITHSFLTVAGFTATVPILSMGSDGKNLRLIMNGCTNESPSPPPLLLGTWNFFASGSGRGLVCLQENTDTDVLGIANCEFPVPQVTTNIRKVGFRNDNTIYCPDRAWYDWVAYISGYDTYGSTAGQVSACALSIPGPGSGIVSVDAVRVFPEGSDAPLVGFEYLPNANTAASFNAQQPGNWFGFSSVIANNVAAGTPVEISFGLTLEPWVTEQLFEALLHSCVVGTDEAAADGTILGGAHLSIASLGSVVAVQPGVTALKDDELLSVQPNPLNRSTTIRFALPKASHVELRVFDVAGRLVRSLDSTNHAEGMHAAVWDGQDEFGIAVAPGTYFVKLTAEGVHRTQKLTVVR